MDFFKKGRRPSKNSDTSHRTEATFKAVENSGQMLPGNPDINVPETPIKSKPSSFSRLFHQLIASLLDKTLWPQRLIILAFAFISVICISFAFLWQLDNKAVYRQESGQVALEDVTAPKEINYSSKILTKEAQERNASDPANQVYRRDESLISVQRDSLNALLEQLRSGRNLGTLAYTVLSANPQVIAARLDNETLQSLLALSDSDWESVASETRYSFNNIMSRNIRPDQRMDEIARLNTLVYAPWNLSPSFSQLDTPKRQIVVNLIKPFIVANSVLDATATKQKQDDARNSTPSIIQNIAKGQNIVRKGDRITALEVEMMEQLGLRNNVLNWQNIAGTVGIIAMLVLVLCLYLGQFHGILWSNRTALAFITLTLIVAAIAIRIMVSTDERSLKPYLLPIAAIAMIVSSLLDMQLALLLSMIISLLVGLVSGSPELILVYFAGCAAGAMSLRKVERTSAFAFAGLAVIGAQFLVALCYYLVINSLDATTAALLIVYNLASGVVSTSLALFSFSILGKLFGVTTVIQLLELAHPSQPLMRRMMRETPGTYHHSMLVGTLAEQAAERLSADSLLARVGAYYHDIGKLARPTYFIDNQGSGPNIHDNLDPRESAKIIRQHVEDGVRLAQEHHLPHRVTDIIHQHHGTCLISYFYHKSVKLGLDINEIDFRYPGPKPQTKIAALVMLADGSEAAVRANVQSGRIITGQTSANPKQHQKHLTIDEVVNKIIEDRIKDGQLDECDLTLRDIEHVRSLFIEILTSIYHPRVDYPDNTRAVQTAEPTVVVNGVVEIPSVIPPGLTTEAADSGLPANILPGNFLPAGSVAEPEATPADDPITDRSRRTIGGAGRQIKDRFSEE